MHTVKINHSFTNPDSHKETVSGTLELSFSEDTFKLLDVEFIPLPSEKDKDLDWLTKAMIDNEADRVVEAENPMEGYENEENGWADYEYQDGEVVKTGHFH